MTVISEKVAEPITDSVEQQIPDEPQTPPEEEYQFTWRATLIGSFLGCFVAASNTYLGLKIGWTFGAGIFGSIFSYAIIKPLSRQLPLRWGGGYFGAKENVTAQTAATTSGGLFSGFISAIPALYKLGLMTTPRKDVVALTLFTISAAFYAVFFAVPLRNHFVVKQDLTFPTPRAAATTILSLHNTALGEKEALRKAKWMAFWFAFTFCWSILGYFVPFFDTLHILWWIGHSTGYTNMMNADAVWSWHFRFDFPFFGAGLMTPGTTVIPFLLVTICVYGIIGPTLVSKGIFLGAYKFLEEGDTARSFFLWPGIAMLVLASFAELFIRYNSIYRSICSAVAELADQSRDLYHRKIRQQSYTPRIPIFDEKYAPHELIPTLWWVSGLGLSLIFTCAIMGTQFGMPVYQTIVAVILAFIMAFVGIQASGETDLNPTGSVAKFSQLLFAGMPGPSVDQIRMNNLMAGNITASAAAQAVDMIGDLKTGHLVGASPRSQFKAQMVAGWFAVGIAVGLFILFTDAYPCIVTQDLNADCPFGLSGVWAWMNVTKLLTGGAHLSTACIIVTSLCGALGALGPIFRHAVLPKKYHIYFPSLSVMGLAMINSVPDVPLAMCIGWIAGQVWKRVHPSGHEAYMYSAAGGMIAGQGVAAILQAIFQLANVEGNVVVASCIDQLKANCP